MTVIDADGHVFEPEEMFADLPREYYPRRPVRVILPPDTDRGDRNACWIVEGRTFPNVSARGRNLFDVPGSAKMRKREGLNLDSATLADVDARLADLDRLGIDVQVVFPTMFLISLVEDVCLEAALYCAYNAYLHRACARSGGRLRWVALIPFRDPEAAVQEVRRAADQGAAGIFAMGMIRERTLADPAFYPVYEAAAAHDLPLCLHFGWATPQLTDIFAEGDVGFCSATVPVMWGFMFAMQAGLLARFPGLRLGLFETGASWVPYVIQQLRRRVGPDGTVPFGVTGIDTRFYRDPEEYFRSGQAVVNCEGDEDFEFLVRSLGEDALLCSSDYPHTDPSSEVNYVRAWQQRTDVPDTLKPRVLGENAARFFRL
jgi:predicted TIM-barrel fold metal-dependent hydrolase